MHIHRHRNIIIPLVITRISDTDNPRITLFNIPTHNPTPLFRLHTHHTPNLNPNIRIMPLLPTLHPHTTSRWTYTSSARTSSLRRS
ncbi:hypothetical protein M422DRAFT_28721, partial [Sphaerobolus stellatus SS14]